MTETTDRVGPLLSAEELRRLHELHDGPSGYVFVRKLLAHIDAQNSALANQNAENDRLLGLFIESQTKAHFQGRELDALKAEVQRLLQLSPDGEVIWTNRQNGSWRLEGFPTLAALLREGT